MTNGRVISDVVQKNISNLKLILLMSHPEGGALIALLCAMVHLTGFLSGSKFSFYLDISWTLPQGRQA